MRWFSTLRNKYLKLLYSVVTEYPLKSLLISFRFLSWLNGHPDLSYDFNFFDVSYTDPLSMSLSPQQKAGFKNEDLAEHLELAKAIVLARRASLGIPGTSVRLGDAGIRLSDVGGTHMAMCFALRHVLSANGHSVAGFSQIVISNNLIRIVRESLV